MRMSCGTMILTSLPASVSKYPSARNNITSEKARSNINSTLRVASCSFFPSHCGSFLF